MSQAQLLALHLLFKTLEAAQYLETYWEAVEVELLR
jgi:hypothetical protein